MAQPSPPWQPAASLAALKVRARVLRELREFFHRRSVLEVQTATLASYSVTEPNIDSIAVDGYGYLQTSPEYQMKRLLAAGAPSIYQLGPAFRHGEAGRLHNPEFTMLEWYRLGFDDHALIAEVAELVNQILGDAPFTTMTYAELLGPTALQWSANDQDLHLVQQLEALVEQGQRRVFIVDYPADQAALARLRVDNPSVAARFELVVDGVEIANGYYELGDAQELTQRFARDEQRRHDQGKRAMALDPHFMAAMQAGLPGCAGVALGVDRLVMLALGATSVQAGMAFPQGFV